MAQFDESKIISPLHPEKAEVGKKYYCSDHLSIIKRFVEEDDTRFIGELEKIERTSYGCIFHLVKGCACQFIYPYEETPKKYRPYKDTEEMINDFCERSGAKRSKMGEPFIWIKPYKNGKNRHLITDIYDEGVYNGDTYLELEDMFRDYCYLDGSPIGKKE